MNAVEPEGYVVGAVCSLHAFMVDLVEVVHACLRWIEGQKVLHISRNVMFNTEAFSQNVLIQIVISRLRGDESRQRAPRGKQRYDYVRFKGAQCSIDASGFT